MLQVGGYQLPEQRLQALVQPKGRILRWVLLVEYAQVQLPEGACLQGLYRPDGVGLMGLYGPVGVALWRLYRPEEMGPKGLHPPDLEGPGLQGMDQPAAGKLLQKVCLEGRGLERPYSQKLVSQQLLLEGLVAEGFLADLIPSDHRCSTTDFPPGGLPHCGCCRDCCWKDWLRRHFWQI